MQIRVRLFAILRDRAGTAEMTLDVPANSSVGAAITSVGERTPAVREFLSRTAFAVNREYVKPDHVLNDGDELALLPPVSGGCDA